MGIAALKDIVHGFFEVPLNAVAPETACPCDLYLMVNGKPILFRRRGEVLTLARLRSLNAHGAANLLVPQDQQDLYQNGLRHAKKESPADLEIRGQALKKAAYAQLEDLFTNTNLQAAVLGTENVVKDMVGFLSYGSAAALSLISVADHDPGTFSHSVNVAVYCILLTKELKGIDPSAFVAAGTAALLHDVGKKNIPRDLLTKPKWTAEEVALVRKHPILGESLLKSVYTIPNKVREAILHHHENYDGSGYPNGVAGDRISEIARIIAIADAFDRLTTDWPTQKAFAADVALELMGSLQPGRFDPSIFRKFKKGTSIQTMGKSLAKDFDPCNPEVIRLVRR